jgi:hypothetical protein
MLTVAFLIVMLTAIVLNVDMMRVMILSIIEALSIMPLDAKCHIFCYSQCHYAKCHYAECHYAECHYAECHYDKCHFAECHYTECHYNQCHYTECIIVSVL